jgi:hypothetical protein
MILMPPSRAAARLPAAIIGISALLMGAAVWSPGAAHAAGGVQVFVGYADDARANAVNFPTPWDGSPGVTFSGCTGTCSFDAGAVRIVNNSASPVTIDSVAVKVSSTDPGNSTPPRAGPLPAYQVVIVSSSISRSGSVISGNTPSLVVVKTNSGYAADPGHAGTGTVVAKIC